MQWDENVLESKFKTQCFKKYKKKGVTNVTGKPLSPVNTAEELFDWPEWINRRKIYMRSIKDKVLSHICGRRKKVIVNLALTERGLFQQQNLEPAFLEVSKAALNMLTCSLGNELAQYDCYIYSVDPGWFIDDRDHLMFTIPLSVDEAAARVLQPVYNNIYPFDSPPAHFGCLMKNFAPAPWSLPTNQRKLF